jgi:hypothetical protein
MAWLSPPIFQAGDAEAEMASRILGGGKASRLYKRLVYDLKIAQSVSAGQISLTLGSVFQVAGTAKPGHTADELEREIDQELARFANEGPSQAEVDGARNAIQASIWMSLESLGGFSGVADRLNRYNHHLGDPVYLEKDLARYDAVPDHFANSYASGCRASGRSSFTASGREAAPADRRIPDAGPDWARTSESAGIGATGHRRPRFAPRAPARNGSSSTTGSLSRRDACLARDRGRSRTASRSAVDPADRHGLAEFTFAMPTRHRAARRSAWRASWNRWVLHEPRPGRMAATYGYAACRRCRKPWACGSGARTDFPSEIERVRNER